jgi:hypothetical protein
VISPVSLSFQYHTVSSPVSRMRRVKVEYGS